MVTSADEFVKLAVTPPGVVIVPPPTDPVGPACHPPNRTELSALFSHPNATPTPHLLELLSPFNVIGPSMAKTSAKSSAIPIASLEAVDDPIPVIVIPPPGAVARIWVPCQPRDEFLSACQTAEIPLLQDAPRDESE